MPAKQTRRRVLQIVAATAACAIAPGRGAQSVEWRGAALGADVSILFSRAAEGAATAAVTRIVNEIERLESIFSLQRGDSELSRLNAAGSLSTPSPDLVHVLAIARRAHALTRGRFDPSVQPLWRHYVAWYGEDTARGRPSEEPVEAVRARVGFQRVSATPEEIRLPPDGGLTLNGIAQGYITDRACDLLRAAGFANVLVDLGETRALDARADGGAWRVGLPDESVVSISGGAIATSAGAATAFADNGDHHIFDPVTGRPARVWRWLSVSHPLAVMADALSTGLYCLAPQEALHAIAAIPGARLWGRDIGGAAIQS